MTFCYLIKTRETFTERRKPQKPYVRVRIFVKLTKSDILLMSFGFFFYCFAMKD